MLTVKPLALVILVLNIFGYIDTKNYERLEKYNVVLTTTYIDLLVFSLVSTLISVMFFSLFIVFRKTITKIKK